MTYYYMKLHTTLQIEPRLQRYLEKIQMFEKLFEKLAILSYIGTFYNRITPKDLTALVFCQLQKPVVAIT